MKRCLVFVPFAAIFLSFQILLLCGPRLVSSEPASKEYLDFDTRGAPNSAAASAIATDEQSTGDLDDNIAVAEIQNFASRNGIKLTEREAERLSRLNSAYKARTLLKLKNDNRRSKLDDPAIHKYPKDIKPENSLRLKESLKDLYMKFSYDGPEAAMLADVLTAMAWRDLFEPWLHIASKEEIIETLNYSLYTNMLFVGFFVFGLGSLVLTWKMFRSVWEAAKYEPVTLPFLLSIPGLRYLKNHFRYHLFDEPLQPRRRFASFVGAGRLSSNDIQEFNDQSNHRARRESIHRHEASPNQSGYSMYASNTTLSKSASRRKSVQTRPLNSQHITQPTWSSIKTSPSEPSIAKRHSVISIATAPNRATVEEKEVLLSLPTINEEEEAPAFEKKDLIFEVSEVEKRCPSPDVLMSEAGGKTPFVTPPESDDQDSIKETEELVSSEGELLYGQSHQCELSRSSPEIVLVGLRGDYKPQPPVTALGIKSKLSRRLYESSGTTSTENEVKSKLSKYFQSSRFPPNCPPVSDYSTKFINIGAQGVESPADTTIRRLHDGDLTPPPGFATRRSFAQSSSLIDVQLSHSEDCSNFLVRSPLYHEAFSCANNLNHSNLAATPDSPGTTSTATGNNLKKIDHTERESFLDRRRRLFSVNSPRTHRALTERRISAFDSSDCTPPPTGPYPFTDVMPGGNSWHWFVGEKITAGEASSRHQGNNQFPFTFADPPVRPRSTSYWNGEGLSPGSIIDSINLGSDFGAIGSGSRSAGRSTPVLLEAESEEDSGSSKNFPSLHRDTKATNGVSNHNGTSSISLGVFDDIFTK